MPLYAWSGLCILILTEKKTDGILVVIPFHSPPPHTLFGNRIPLATRHSPISHPLHSSVIPGCGFGPSLEVNETSQQDVSFY